MDTSLYVINLDHKPEEWNRAHDHIKTVGFSNVNRYPAIAGKKVPDHELVRLLSVRALHDLGTAKETHEGIYSFGAVGCYMSHTNLWKKLLESYDECMIVCEDDVSIHDDFDNTVFDRLPKDFDIVLLGYDRIFSSKQCDFEEPYSKDFDKVTGRFFGLEFYIISRKGAEKALKSAFPMEMQVDNYLGFMAESGNLDIYIPKKSMATQLIHRSDIQDLCVKCILPANMYFYTGVVLLILSLLILCIVRMRK